MRIARPITSSVDSVSLPTGRYSSFAAIAFAFDTALSDAETRATNRADVAMARNLKRSRGLAQRREV